MTSKKVMDVVNENGRLEMHAENLIKERKLIIIL